jgi:hypothetical protein
MMALVCPPILVKMITFQINSMESLMASAKLMGHWTRVYTCDSYYIVTEQNLRF